MVLLPWLVTKVWFVRMGCDTCSCCWYETWQKFTLDIQYHILIWWCISAASVWNFAQFSVVTRCQKIVAGVAAPSPSKCKFPLWLTASQHWHTLDYRRSYTFHKHNTTLRITNMTAQPGTSQHTGSGSTVQGYAIYVAHEHYCPQWCDVL